MTTNDRDAARGATESDVPCCEVVVSESADAPEVVQMWENRARSEGAVNTPRPLTRSSDYGREGLAMKATRHIPCEPFEGTEKAFQERASLELEWVGREPAMWSWITTECGTRRCIEPEHLRINAPIRLAYPHGVCVYCGRHAGTRDHLLPRNWTGDAQRHFIVTVPACGTCNSILRDTITTSITERRALCHARLRRHFRKVLRTQEFSEGELGEFGPTMRDYLVAEMVKKSEVLRILTWPIDAGYDLRAIAKSGIEDPFILGLIVADDNPEMLRYVNEVA